jgi:hypothetical protein
MSPLTYIQYIPTYKHRYTYTYIHTYIHKYIHTYVHIYIHTYMHTYMHTYICTRDPRPPFPSWPCRAPGTGLPVRRAAKTKSSNWSFFLSRSVLSLFFALFFLRAPALFFFALPRFFSFALASAKLTKSAVAQL